MSRGCLRVPYGRRNVCGWRGRAGAVMLFGALVLGAGVPGPVEARSEGRGAPPEYLTREQADAGLPARLDKMRERDRARRQRRENAGARPGGTRRPGDRGRVAPPHAAPLPPLPPELE